MFISIVVILTYLAVMLGIMFVVDYAARHNRYVATIMRYSGMEAILRKFYPRDVSHLPTGIPWIIGIYLVLHGLACAKYQHQFQYITTTISYEMSSLSSLSKMDRYRAASRVRNLQLIIAPDVLHPSTVINALIGRLEDNDLSTNAAKQILTTLKKNMANVADVPTVSGLDLDGFDFSGCNFMDSSFYNCSLRNVNFSNISSDGLCFFFCDLSDSNFKDAFLDLVHFDNCDFYNSSIALSRKRDPSISNAKNLPSSLEKYVVEYEPDAFKKLKH